jgi:uncharacterized cupin superfamily protein
MEPHANVGHWDDVEPFVIDRGELQGRRWRLGAAVGTAEVGLSRYLLGPGERAMPAHVHADEEELFFVLAGSGMSWQDGRTHAIRAGDVVVHRANAEAHTWIAGPDGIDVLAYGEGSRTRITWLPRANAWWLGPRWIPADGPNPFALEAAAGPLELPETPSPRPATIKNVGELPLEVEVHGRYAWHMRDLGRGAGSVTSGLRHDHLKAGQWTCPPHWHSAEEELFVVLEGTGEVELGTQRYPLRAGSIVARPPGTGVEHALVGGPSGMTYLAYGTRRPYDVAHFPRTRKISFAGGRTVRVEDVGYWDGE